MAKHLSIHPLSICSSVYLCARKCVRCQGYRSNKTDKIPAKSSKRRVRNTFIYSTLQWVLKKKVWQEVLSIGQATLLKEWHLNQDLSDRTKKENEKLCVQRSCGRKDLVVVGQLREDLSDWSFMRKERGAEEVYGEGRGFISLGFILRKSGSLWRV